MAMTLSVRDLVQEDLPALRAILDDTGLFPSDMLSDMAAPYLAGSAPHLWLVACRAGTPIGFAYCEPERMTDGTFNLLAIAVMTEAQGQGIGAALIEHLERALQRLGARILLVETSSFDEYARTREFYDHRAFTREARIRDFYAVGEDKIVFWKSL